MKSEKNSRNKKLIQWIEMGEGEVKLFAYDFIQKAINDIKVARWFLEEAEIPKEIEARIKGKVEYSQSLSASLESMEFSFKTIFLLLRNKYPREHKLFPEIKEELNEEIKGEVNKIINLLSKSSTHLLGLTAENLLFYWDFWLKNYTLTKYGDEKRKIPPSKIISRELAKIALEYAEECKEVARHIYNLKIVT